MAFAQGFEVAEYANGAGFAGQDLTYAIAISYAETKWQVDYLFKAPETEQRGLWAIDWANHTDFDRAQLMHPEYNSWAARQLFLRAGNTFTDWESFIDGSYVDYFPQAAAAIAQFESIGGNPGSSNAPPASNYPPPINSGLYPNFGPFDPAPAIRQFGDILNNWANQVRNAVDSIYGLMR